jgi:hypothetical protein
VRSHLERHHVLVAEDEQQVVERCLHWTVSRTFVSLVGVRRIPVGAAWPHPLPAPGDHVPSPRLFSSTEETNAVSIRMHSALGFSPAGQIDNLPQGYRELLFYKRLRG